MGWLTARYHNRLVPRGRGVEPVFAEGLSCRRCAVCKAEVVRRHVGERRRRGAFCGDGSSDRCAAGVADEVYAVAGGVLAEHCNEEGVPHVRFDDMGTVLRALSA